VTPGDPQVGPGLVISQGSNSFTFPYYYLGSDFPRQFTRARIAAPAFVSARGVSDGEVARWWDTVALKEAEERVKKCLQIVAPVERINLIEHPSNRGERMVMVRVRGDSDPAPLKSLGDGMSRMFQLALALEVESVRRAAPGKFTWEAPPPSDKQTAGENGRLLFIDEIENGIHYTVQADLWKFVIEVAELHGIQVFATSHSWDSILGLREAARDKPDAGAAVIRLESCSRGTKAVLFSQKELDIISRDGIEVR
jgi:hypothetical protein